MKLVGADETYAVEDVSVVEADVVDSISSFVIVRCHGAESVESTAAATTNSAQTTSINQTFHLLHLNDTIQYLAVIELSKIG